MKLFGWKSAGRDVRPVLARYGLWSAGGSSGEWADDYAAQVRQGYCRNAVAQRAVRLVAQGLAGAPVTASSPELLALVSARSGGQALTETVAAHLLLHGNAYVQIMTDPAGQVVELFALRPAAKDMAELRELLRAWRDAKRSAWKAVVGWVARIGGAVLLAGLAARFGFWDWVK